MESIVSIETILFRDYDMLKKILLVSSLCAVTFATSPVFAVQQARLQVVNKTKVSPGWLSVAKFEANSHSFTVCSEGFCDKTSQTQTILPFQKYAVKFVDFIFGNGHLNPSHIDESCKNIVIIGNPMETKTITVYPADDIGWDSVIFCKVTSSY